MSPHTCLVTGSAGFIGSHLARALLAKGCAVVGVDNLNGYYLPALKQARRAELLTREGYQDEVGDIADFAYLDHIFEKYSIDQVCHLAAQPGVRYSLINPFAYQRSNLQGFLNVLECCRRRGVARLVYASSSSVYGESPRQPFTEDLPVDEPVSLYAATKRANELMAHTYSHLYGLQTVGLRFFTVYGPQGRPDMAPWLFARAIMRGRPITLFNNGDMARDFTYIDDIVAGILTVMDSPALSGCVVLNLGCGNPQPLSLLVDLLEEHLGRPASRRFADMQPGDVKATYADISRARALVGFSPRTALPEGIAAFAAWFLHNPGLTWEAPDYEPPPPSATPAW